MHYNGGGDSYIFVNGIEIHKFKAKDSEIKATLLYVGNISKGFPVDNIKYTAFHVYVCDFSFDYDAAAVDDTLDIQKYLM